MYTLGLKMDWIGSLSMTDFLLEQTLDVFPVELPQVLIAGVKSQGVETLYVCQELSDIEFLRTHNPEINWYIGPNPISMLIERVMVNLPDETGNVPCIVCQCESFNCGLNVQISEEEALEVARSGLVPIVDGCRKGPNSTDEWVEDRQGYKLYRES